MSTNFDSMEDVVNRAEKAGSKLISPELKDHLSNIGESLGEIGLTRSHHSRRIQQSSKIHHAKGSFVAGRGRDRVFRCTAQGRNRDGAGP